MRANISIRCQPGEGENLPSLGAAARLLAQGAAPRHLQAGAGRAPPGATGEVAEGLPEAGGHQVVEDGVDGGAQVEEDSGDEVDLLEDPEVVLGGHVHAAPHQAVQVKRGPAEAEDHDQDAWGRRGGHLFLEVELED